MKSTTLIYNLPRTVFACCAVAALLFTGCSGKMNTQEAEGSAVLEEQADTDNAAAETTAGAGADTPADTGSGTKFTYIQPGNLAGDEKKMMIDARAAGFRKLDTDNDDIVEKDEFYDGLFAMIDANRDNALDARELEREVDFWNRNGNPALDSFAEWDADADQKISKEELRSELAALIDVPNGETLAQNLYVVWDTDNDNRIEMLELENVAIRFDADEN